MISPSEHPSLFDELPASDPSPPASRLPKKAKTPIRRATGIALDVTVGKHYVLDTNVLLHDPGSLFRFEENHLVIPGDVLCELDKFKNEQSDRGANARAVHRHLAELFSGAASRDPSGVPLPGGGTLRLAVYDPGDRRLRPEALRHLERVFPDTGKPDHRILACSLLVMEHNHTPVVLVTKDLNLQLKARALGVHCEDYRNDKVSEDTVSDYALPELMVTPAELQRFASSGALPLPEDVNYDINQYVLLDTGVGGTMPARVGESGELQRLRVPKCIRVGDGATIKPLNLGQQCLFDALFDPSISLVTCFGRAGTGKTMLAVAAALAQTVGHGETPYHGVTVSRPVVAMGDTLGFLPGSLEDKLSPWLQPIHDALSVIMSPPRDCPTSKRKRQKAAKNNDIGDDGRKPYEAMVESGVIEVEALCYIRGRSIPHRFFILDEAQQLSPREAKTVVTRMAEGSKLVLVGDPAQIDNAYVDSRSNGLVYTRERMRGLPFVSHVGLTRGERSSLAEAGADRM